MEYRNPVYNALGTIDCEIYHQDYGWIPFTASPDDTELHGRELYDAIVKAGNIRSASTAPIDYDKMDLDSLNDVFTQRGSVMRALAVVMFQEINKLRVKNGDSEYTMTQFKAMLQGKMR